LVEESGTMGKGIAILAGGLVTIGVITALFMPGRQTVAGVKAVGSAGSNLLGTAIRG
jgi:hypothetical protein